MAKHILLLDNSITVQKVVSLTLDRSRYRLTIAESRAEAMQKVAETLPDVILVSDQASGIDPMGFPREVESWVGQLQKPPALVLITKENRTENRNYIAMLRKPFTPVELERIVTLACGQQPVPPVVASPKVQHSSVPSSSSLWEVGMKKNMVQSPNPQFPKVSGGNSDAIEQQLSQDLDQLVDRVLNKIVPPIVEKMVRERLDALLEEKN